MGDDQDLVGPSQKQKNGICLAEPAAAAVSNLTAARL